LNLGILFAIVICIFFAASVINKLVAIACLFLLPSATSSERHRLLFCLRPLQLTATAFACSRLRQPIIACQLLPSATLADAFACLPTSPLTPRESIFWGQ